MKYYKMDTRGGLKESLETKIEITEEEFNKLLPMYKYYAYDKRINCYRYILIDMENNYKEYTTWLLQEDD